MINIKSKSMMLPLIFGSKNELFSLKESEYFNRSIASLFNSEVNPISILLKGDSIILSKRPVQDIHSLHLSKTSHICKVDDGEFYKNWGLLESDIEFLTDLFTSNGFVLPNLESLSSKQLDSYLVYFSLKMGGIGNLSKLNYLRNPVGGLLEISQPNLLYQENENGDEFIDYASSYGIQEGFHIDFVLSEHSKISLFYGPEPYQIHMKSKQYTSHSVVNWDGERFVKGPTSIVSKSILSNDKFRFYNNKSVKFTVSSSTDIKAFVSLLNLSEETQKEAYFRLNPDGGVFIDNLFAVGPLFDFTVLNIDDSGMLKPIYQATINSAESFATLISSINRNVPLHPQSYSFNDDFKILSYKEYMAKMKISDPDVAFTEWGNYVHTNETAQSSLSRLNEWYDKYLNQVISENSNAFEAVESFNDGDPLYSSSYLLVLDYDCVNVSDQLQISKCGDALRAMLECSMNPNSSQDISLANFDRIDDVSAKMFKEIFLTDNPVLQTFFSKIGRVFGFDTVGYEPLSFTEVPTNIWTITLGGFTYKPKTGNNKLDVVRRIQMKSSGFGINDFIRTQRVLSGESSPEVDTSLISSSDPLDWTEENFFAVQQALKSLRSGILAGIPEDILECYIRVTQSYELQVEEIDILTTVPRPLLEISYEKIGSINGKDVYQYVEMPLSEVSKYSHHMIYSPIDREILAAYRKFDKEAFLEPSRWNWEAPIFPVARSCYSSIPDILSCYVKNGRACMEISDGHSYGNDLFKIMMAEFFIKLNFYAELDFSSRHNLGNGGYNFEAINLLNDSTDPKWIEYSEAELSDPNGEEKRIIKENLNSITEEEAQIIHHAVIGGSADDLPIDDSLFSSANSKVSAIIDNFHQLPSDVCYFFLTGEDENAHPIAYVLCMYQGPAVSGDFPLIDAQGTKKTSLMNITNKFNSLHRLITVAPTLDSSWDFRTNTELGSKYAIGKIFELGDFTQKGFDVPKTIPDGMYNLTFSSQSDGYNVHSEFGSLFKDRTIIGLDCSPVASGFILGQFETLNGYTLLQTDHNLLINSESGCLKDDFPLGKLYVSRNIPMSDEAFEDDLTNESASLTEDIAVDSVLEVPLNGPLNTMTLRQALLNQDIFNLPIWKLDDLLDEVVVYKSETVVDPETLEETINRVKVDFRTTFWRNIKARKEYISSEEPINLMGGKDFNFCSSLFYHNLIMSSPSIFLQMLKNGDIFDDSAKSSSLTPLAYHMSLLGGQHD